MRFLADENFPGAAVAALTAAGSDVVWIRIAAPGCSDSEVLARAAREQRILLTFDKDFGELAKASALPAASGVVLLRLPMPAPEKIGDFACRPNIAASRLGWPLFGYRAWPRPDATAWKLELDQCGERRYTRNK